ncbi:MAG: LysM peptidoglycan-binding domain-containing protein [Elusimicrobia bacterium]|nr:LysM peptidoglycan-binding domain-containing protein [Elusimicrobiota bacterium]
MGLGYAVHSLAADDPFAIFYNPAGPANTPYVQFGATMGRNSSPRGTMVFGALTYLRPFEPINTATIGGAYLIERQDRGGDKDVVNFHFSREYKVPYLNLARPVRVGGNFKMINAEGLDGAGFGVGLDGGLLLRTNMGLALGISIMDLTTMVGMPRLVYGLGTSYTWRKRLTLAADMRIRDGLTEFYPGIEASFMQGLLKARMGRGLRLDLVETLAFGLGLNFSPLVIDLGMAIPPAGIFRPGGAYQASFNYRFGAPPFAGAFVGNAANEAETLKGQINELDNKKKDLDNETEVSRTNRDSTQAELKEAEARLRETQEEFRKVMKKKDETAYDLQLLEMRIPPKPQAKPQPKPKPKPKVWPDRHAAQPGETLRSIAKQYYGDSSLWELIYEANRGKIDRGFPIEGAVLVIPDPKAAR